MPELTGQDIHETFLQVRPYSSKKHWNELQADVQTAYNRMADLLNERLSARAREELKTCADFAAQGEWDTSLCCPYCHGLYENDEGHEMKREYHGELIEVCIPLFEQLFCGAAHFEKIEV